MSSVNYMQIAPMTDRQKLKMYMKCTKKELAKMLIEANRVIAAIGPVVRLGAAVMNKDMLPDGTGVPTGPQVTITSAAKK